MAKKPSEVVSIYNSNLNVSQDFKKNAIEVFKNHLVAYNMCLEIAEKEPDLSFDERVQRVMDFLNQNNLKYYANPLLNELHYQSKNIQRGIYRTKTIDDIQYLTITDNTIKVNYETRKLECRYIQGDSYLVNTLDEDTFIRKKYVNLSYSIKYDEFSIKIFG